MITKHIASLPPPYPPSMTNVLMDGFEDGIGNWDQHGDGTIEASTEKHHTGYYSLKIYMTGSNTRTHISKLVNFKMSSTRVIEIWFYFVSASYTGWKTIIRINLLSEGDKPTILFRLNESGGNVYGKFSACEEGGSWQNYGDFSVTKNSWHNVTIFSNSSFTWGYFDNELKAETDVLTNGWKYIGFGQDSGLDNSPIKIYFDDIKIDKSLPLSHKISDYLEYGEEVIIRAMDGAYALKDNVGTHTWFSTRWDYDSEERWIAHKGYPYLLEGIRAYELTGNSTYLNWAKNTVEDIINYALSEKNLICVYNITSDTVLTETTSIRFIDELILLQKNDYSYRELVVDIINAIYKYQVNSTTKLISKVFSDGTPSDSSCWQFTAIVPWISACLSMYELTLNETYKVWANETLYGYWNTRDDTTNLMPRVVDSFTGNAKDGYDYMKEGDEAGNWLNLLNYAYRITGYENYKDIIKTFADSICQYFWDSSQEMWYYQVNTDGTVKNNAHECVFGLLDQSMILAYEITGNNTYLSYARKDFDHLVLEEKIIKTEIIVHAIDQSGKPTKLEGLFNPSIYSVLSSGLLYKVTGNSTYLDYLKDLFVAEEWSHRQEKYGYIYSVNALSWNTSTPSDMVSERPEAVIKAVEFLWSSLRIESRGCYSYYITGQPIIEGFYDYAVPSKGRGGKVIYFNFERRHYLKIKIDSNPEVDVLIQIYIPIDNSNFPDDKWFLDVFGVEYYEDSWNETQRILKIWTKGLNIEVIIQSPQWWETRIPFMMGIVGFIMMIGLITWTAKEVLDSNFEALVWGFGFFIIAIGLVVAWLWS